MNSIWFSDYAWTCPCHHDIFLSTCRRWIRQSHRKSEHTHIVLSFHQEWILSKCLSSTHHQFSQWNILTSLKCPILHYLPNLPDFQRNLCRNLHFPTLVYCLFLLFRKYDQWWDSKYFRNYQEWRVFRDWPFCLLGTLYKFVQLLDGPKSQEYKGLH